ncbi:MAG TPA: hypothetical protein VGQ36_22435 [Thermoanaerobaculia bacterium]|jgi:hypothetical protein|nr:hypothetical protein [Thermoanaerobaculia bacterium]
MRLLGVALFLALATAPLLTAHPGAAIAVAGDGRVYFTDTGGGNFVIERDRRIVRLEGSAFHWFAYDPQNRFRATRWPSMADAEFQSAGTNPTLVLSSDFPVAIGTDGRFYFPERFSGDRVRIVGMQPSGARAIHATLPPVQSGGRAVAWLNGLAAGPRGSLYYTEDRAVKRIDAQGHVSVVAANVTVPNCTAIPGIEVERPYLRGLAVAADGSVYVAASGCGALLKIDSKGKPNVILRTTAPWAPTAVAVANGEVYVLEYSHTASDNRREWMPRVRKISRAGAVTSLGGITSR